MDQLECCCEKFPFQLSSFNQRIRLKFIFDMSIRDTRFKSVMQKFLSTFSSPRDSRWLAAFNLLIQTRNGSPNQDFYGKMINGDYDVGTAS